MVHSFHGDLDAELPNKICQSNFTLRSQKMLKIVLKNWKTQAVNECFLQALKILHITAFRLRISFHKKQKSFSSLFILTKIDICKID